MKIEGTKLKSIENEDIVNGTISIPVKVNELNSYLFSNNSLLTNIKIPINVDKLGFSLFENCSNLQKVSFDNSLRYLSQYIFKDCTNLKKVHLPRQTSIIPSYAFENCSSLKSIHLPNNIRTIDSFAFENCSSLKNINFPQKLKMIDSSAFSNCTSLNKISLPEDVKEIGNFAFFNCKNISSVKFSDGTKHILNNSFANCTSLKKITLPEQLLTLGEFAFANCENLKSANIPAEIKEISSGAFLNCSALSKVKLNDKIQKISSKAFENCSSLTEINLPKKLFKIGESAFENCTNLQTVSFKNNLGTISKSAFANCENLASVELPYSLTAIGSEAFKNCKKLQRIVIHNTVSAVGDNVFDGCDNLDAIFLPNTLQQLGNVSSFKYFTRNGAFRGFILSKKPTEDSIPLEKIKISPVILSKYWNHKDNLMKEQNNPNICKFYNTFFMDLNQITSIDILNNHNFTFLKKFNLENNSTEDLKSFFKLVYNLGGISTPIEKNGKTINYAQKVCEFLIEKTKKGQFSIDGLNLKLRTMEINGFNKDFTDFFISNFDELFNNDDLSIDFISKSYNQFEKIQMTNTSNRGNQRQLKPTVEKFAEFFRIGKFKNVTPESKIIAETIAPYTSKQSSFDNAVKIEQERIDNNVPNNILSFHLKETPEDKIDAPVFDKIKEYATYVNNFQVEIVSNLKDVAENEFTFDWLEKNDPENLILGKLCSCCAHLEGMGYGIMNASIVDPRVQNLVIRDEHGDIVAKSTLFVNTEKGYGICNNVEVNMKVSAFKHKQIYEKYMLGIQKFVEHYNTEHPDKKITKINVGMGNNDLEFIFRQINKKEKNLLKPLNYADFGTPSFDHSGDSNYEQFIVWEEKEK